MDAELFTRGGFALTFINNLMSVSKVSESRAKVLALQAFDKLLDEGKIQAVDILPVSGEVRYEYC
jgi:hypothetical protein